MRRRLIGSTIFTGSVLLAGLLSGCGSDSSLEGTVGPVKILKGGDCSVTLRLDKDGPRTIQTVRIARDAPAKPRATFCEFAAVSSAHFEFVPAKQPKGSGQLTITRPDTYKVTEAKESTGFPWNILKPCELRMYSVTTGEVKSMQYGDDCSHHPKINETFSDGMVTASAPAIQNSADPS